MKLNPSYRDLKTVAQGYLPPSDIAQIDAAYEFADIAHKNQLRLSKDAYITHPVAVAYILATLGQDCATICGGLLHDTVEDCSISVQDISDAFSPEIAQLVEGVTKIGQIKFKSTEEEQAENFRKMVLAMAKDIRVVIIKLADRVHNMRTLMYLSPRKQQIKARETMDIFAPLAHRLGMGSIKWELEDLAFLYLNSTQFNRVKKMVAASRKQREALVHQFVEDVTRLLADKSIKAKIKGRPKHLYSIFCKIQRHKVSVKEIYDTLGIRIVVKTISECYEALGVIHAAYIPITGRFKDYIAMPKSNLYQSLHTTVIGPKGHPVEVQIRTKTMHRIAEFGIAAHWQYKSGKEARQDQQFSWLRELVELQAEKLAPAEFMNQLKVDLFVDEVFVLSPKGDVHVFPRGATPVDFAYKIHSQIGHRCVGAKVNGKIVTLNYPLKNGDRVEVLTGKKEMPNLDWLSFVKSRHAKNKLKAWFKRQNKANIIEKGRAKLTALFSDYKWDIKKIEEAVKTTKILDKLNVDTFDELCFFIGQGDLTGHQVLNEIQRKTQLKLPIETPTPLVVPRRARKSATGGVKVHGQSGIATKLAKCCHPLPGDDIIGYVTIGAGVSIHRQDCRHILSLKPDSRARLIDVTWDEQNSHTAFPAVLEIEAFDRVGILQEVVAKISSSNTNIREITSRVLTQGSKMTATVTVEIQNQTHLRSVIGAIEQLKDVFTVKRVIK